MNNKIIVSIFVLVIIIFYYRFVNKDVDYMTSDVDGNTYMVRDLEDKQNAVNILAKIRKNIFIITNYLYENKKNYPEFEKNIDKLYHGIQNVDISESTEDNGYTSYTVNKGTQMVYCIRSKVDNNKLHDFNLITYVMLHELAHCAAFSINHTDEFRDCFALIAKEAVKIGLYKKIDFAKDPMEYCGIQVTESII